MTMGEPVSVVHKPPQLGQVAHLVGDHREAASGLAGARGFDGGVEGEQVGLLGDALDHFEDLADVHRAAVEGLDVGAGGADLLGKLVHRADGLLDHLLAVLGLVVGVGRMVRGIGGVAGDFLGGGAEFVDRRGDAVGAVGLLVGVGHRRCRGLATMPRNRLRQWPARRSTVEASNRSVA